VRWERLECYGAMRNRLTNCRPYHRRKQIQRSGNQVATAARGLLSSLPMDQSRPAFFPILFESDNRPSDYESNRINDCNVFQRLDGAGNDTESLKRHQSTVLDHSRTTSKVLRSLEFALDKRLVSTTLTISSCCRSSPLIPWRPERSRAHDL